MYNFLFQRHELTFKKTIALNNLTKHERTSVFKQIFYKI